MRIFMEGHEEWAEPCGEAMVAIAKFLLLPGAFVAFFWAVLIALVRHRWPSGHAIATVVLSVLCLAFWVAGRVSIFVGRKMRERGIKLP